MAGGTYELLPSDAHEDNGYALEHIHPIQPGSHTIKTTNGGTLTVRLETTDTHLYSFTYAYGPTGLEGIFRHRYAAGCAIFASVGGLSFGYDQGVIANVLVMKDFVERWPVGPWEKGLMTAVLELGALFGALLSGVLADRYSRRNAIFLASLIFCIGSGIQTKAQSLGELIVGRAIGGLGVGALSMLSPLYMAEISPPELRGSLLALEQLAIVLGVVVGFWTGFLTRNVPGSASWRIPLALQFFPGLALCLGCFLLPPSPRFLVLKGRLEDAMQSLAKLRLRTATEAARDPLLRLEMLEMQVNVALEMQESDTADIDRAKGVICSWTQLFTKKYINRTSIGILIMFFQQWSGINSLLYYGPTIVTSIGIKGNLVTLIVSGGIGIVQFLAVIPAILYLDKWGRKPLLRGGSAMMTLSHLIIAVLIYRYEDNWASYPLAAWLAVTCIYSFTAAYGMSFGPIGWVLPSEVFPLPVRGKGVSISTASNWINNFLIGLITPPMMQTSPTATFLLFATACLAAHIWSTHLVPETAGASLEDMDAVFESKVGMEERKVKHQLEQKLGVHDLVRDLIDRSD